MSSGGPDNSRENRPPGSASAPARRSAKPAAGKRKRLEVAATAPGEPQAESEPEGGKAPNAPSRRESEHPPPDARSIDETELPPTPPAHLGRGSREDGASESPTHPGRAASSFPTIEGIRVHQFELIRELGHGGMGQVFLARDTRLGRRVALKFLTLDSAELSERFLAEARATARCQHENIVVIYEVDEWQGKPYMALEYLEGQPLYDVIRGRTLSARRAVEVAVPVVRALGRAHEFNLVHRDLKPDNIFVTRDGLVKVLDFGIAKLFTNREEEEPQNRSSWLGIETTPHTQAGGLVGTMPYMAPEQFGTDAVDHRTDFWALGIILWEMLAGRHPLEPLTSERLWQAAAALDEPMPRIGDAVPDLPAALEALVDRCTAKRKGDRFSSAAELLDHLETLLPGRSGRRLEEGESPYPGLSAFQESDADRFFGRQKDILQTVERVRAQPLVGLVGPSGVGKSSFVRAGVVPALRASGEPWEVLMTRPGRDPLSGLATLLQPLTSSASNLETQISEHWALTERLRREPGFLGTLLRSRARQKRERILLFIDQLEELYTLAPDEESRRAYAACLAGVADDASTPIRVVVSMRSDFLDRAAEDRRFMDQLTRGLLFLPPVGREGMREALTQPLERAGYQFEHEWIITDMLDELEQTEGRLPLLQFTASKLWDDRDRQRRLLTSASYGQLGGLAGALATHADEVLARLSPPQQKLARSAFQRLVTSDGTRALADVSELRELARDPDEVQTVLDALVEARLLVVHARGQDEGSAVEIVHESLIESWPTLRRWLDESAEDSAFLEQLRTAANQWEVRGRPSGLLWRGEAMEEARRFRERFTGDLSERERNYLDAVIRLATRATRRKRTLVIGAFAFLLVLIAAAAVALVWIRQAEQDAQEQKALAEKEAERAREAETEASRALEKVERQLETIQERERERDAARQAAEKAEQRVDMTKEELQDALGEARREKARAERAQQRAERARGEAEKAAGEIEELAAAERKAKERIERLLEKERARVEELEKEKERLSTELK